ncbi:hypothetical protein C8R47DRAFT_969394 [Mycena vitilis]|nr:hypothetical protein C8R47DRAFT_969394 [Mycena vitilis]
MFSDLPTYFGVPVTPDLHSVVIAGLLRQGYVALAQQWIATIADRPPHVVPTLEHYHTFLKECPTHVSAQLLREMVILKMRQSGVRPTNETFSILLRCIIHNATVAKTSVHTETFNSILTDMKLHRLIADPDILALMLDHFSEHGLLFAAETVRQNFSAQFPDLSTKEEQQKDEWRKRLAAASHHSGVGHALEVFRELQAQGCTATPEIFRSIVNASKSVQDIRTVEQALGVRADVSIYAVLVNNNIRVKQLTEALDVYDSAKNAGLPPVAGLVAPIIRSLVSNKNKFPAEFNTHLDTALALYSDLEEAFPAPDPESPDASVNDPSEHSNGPDVNIYTSLLRGLAFSTNAKGAFSIAESLFADMKARHIALTRAIKTSHLILEMRQAKHLDEAFRRYRKSRAELTESDYSVVLHAFSNLSSSFGHPAVLEYYLQMVGDMRLAGFKVTDKIYTDILHQFARLGTSRRMDWRNSPQALHHAMPSDMFDDLLGPVRQIHDIVSLDTTIAPERIVSNQLMDTYQRLGSFPEAYRIWENLFLSGKYGPVGVSIILDGCGYAGEFEIANRIVINLMAANYVLNLHNWNSYVECLCRVNQVSEALKVVCTVMGTEAQPVKPDLSTLTIMLKLAESRFQINTILTRVKRLLPELWASLPENMNKPP